MFEAVKPKKSRLAKAATIFAATFGISLGLCGVNFVAVMASGGNAIRIADGFIFVTAYLEVFGMIVGAGGLLTVGLVALVRKVRESFSTKDAASVSIIEKNKEK